jgi:hypothetical protein
MLFRCLASVAGVHLPVVVGQRWLQVTKRSALAVCLCAPRVHGSEGIGAGCGRLAFALPKPVSPVSMCSRLIWCGLIASGDIYYAIVANSLVHLFMYTYYLIATVSTVSV